MNHIQLVRLEYLPHPPSINTTTASSFLKLSRSEAARSAMDIMEASAAFGFSMNHQT